MINDALPFFHYFPRSVCGRCGTRRARRDIPWLILKGVRFPGLRQWAVGGGVLGEEGGREVKKRRERREGKMRKRGREEEEEEEESEEEEELEEREEEAGVGRGDGERGRQGRELGKELGGGSLTEGAGRGERRRGVERKGERKGEGARWRQGAGGRRG